MHHESQADSDAQSAGPPSLDVPTSCLSIVEHPYIINNVTKGVQSIGGDGGLSSLVSRPIEGRRSQVRLLHGASQQISKPNFSENVATHNLALEITVPKLLKCKRKRAPDEPNEGVTYSSRPCTAREHTRYLLRCMKHDAKRVRIEPIGIIDQTHRFRTLSDFASPIPNGEFINKLHDTFFSSNYSKLKHFNLDLSKATKSDAEIIPPPFFTPLEIPFNYAYRQNAGVLTSVNDQGQLSTMNTQLIPKVHYQPVPANSASVPAFASPDLPPVSSLEPHLQRLITATIQVMETRPIITRRSLPNLLPDEGWVKAGQNLFKLLVQYVGYTFASGPWRDAVVRFGVDPRKDPRYRIYQTLMFQLETGSMRKPSDLKTQSSSALTLGEHSKNDGHVFDGSRLTSAGKLWQVCDITDPVLHDLLATKDLRQECHTEADGWYQNGTLVKVKLIMRWKIRQILDGVEFLSNAQYARVAAVLPNNLAGMGDFYAMLGTTATPKERELAANIRAALRKDKVDEVVDASMDDDDAQDLGEVPD